MSAREATVREFCSRSGADEKRARFFLEVEAWDLELALQSYFLNDGASEEANNAIPDVPIDETIEVPDSDPEVISDDANFPDIPPAESSITVKKNKSKKTSSTKFSTLQNLLNQDSSSDEEEGQAFYAGGSVRSGQQILGPSKNKDDIVADMFKSVKEHGGIIVAPSQDAPGSASFSGTGYKLGATLDDSTVVRQTNVDLKKKYSEEEVTILRFWRNGFSLDDGELRPFNDPSNTQFLEFIRRGEIPPELRSDNELYLTMEDRRHEDFNRQALGPAKPFQGKGQLLGSPAPTIVGSTAPQPIGSKDQESNQSSAQAGLNVNENEPTTNIQFRLADGSRISGRFNHTHTIANIRDYITRAVPVYQLQNFILLTTFPNKELSDFNQTIKDAGLLNALVVQRLK